MNSAGPRSRELGSEGRNAGQELRLRRPAEPIVGKAEQTERMLDVRGAAHAEHDEARAPAKRLRDASAGQRLAKRPRHRDVRLAVEVQMTELLLADIEVGAVDLALVAEEPVRARVDRGPARERLRHGLRVGG